MKKFIGILVGVLGVAGISFGATPITGYVQINPPISPQSGAFSTSSGTVGQLSITGLSAGQCVQTGVGGAIITSGLPCNVGGGSGSGNGNVVASPQYQIPYYALSGTTTTVSGISGITTDNTLANLNIAGQINVTGSAKIGNLVGFASQCLKADSSGNISGTGAACPTGGGNSIYPSTGTPDFPFGLQVSTVQTSTITLQNSILDQSSGNRIFAIGGTGGANLFVGNSAGNYTESGIGNTAIGYFSLNALTSGGTDTALGASSLGSLTSGSSNIGAGDNSLFGVTSGAGNTAYGYNSGYNTVTGNGVVSGSSNTFVGYNAGTSNSSLINGIAIGANSVVTTNNTAVIGGGAGTFNSMNLIVSSAVTQSHVTTNLTVGSPTSTSLGNNPYAVFSASGTSQAIQINVNGTPSGGAQNEIGGVTINGPTNFTDSNNSPALLVLQDSTTNNSNGAGLLELWETNPNHDSYLLWIHGDSNRNSDEPIRFDGPTFGIDEVNVSTDETHGLGKWKVISEGYQAVDSQIVSPRAWDNTTFENLLYATPFTQPWLQPAGIWLQAQSLTDDSAVLTSSDTSVYGWNTQNNHLVGLTAPLNPTASWTFALPATFNNLGQVLYQSDNGRGNNNNARSWAFTTGGTTNNILQYNSGSAPTWTDTLSVSSGTIGSFTSTNVAINSGLVVKNLTGPATFYTSSQSVASPGVIVYQPGFAGIYSASYGFAQDGPPTSFIRRDYFNSGNDIGAIAFSSSSLGGQGSTVGDLAYFNTDGSFVLVSSQADIPALRLGNTTGLTQCLESDQFGNVIGTGSSCGGSGGGSSSLQVTQSGVQITSPTASMNFSSSGFSLGSAGSTATIALNSNVAFINAAQTWSGQNLFAGPAVSSFTYGVNFGSITLNNNTSTGVLFLSGKNMSTTSTFEWNGSTLTATDASHTLLTTSGLYAANGNVNISSGVLLSGISGTSGQVMTSGGSGGIPTWTTVASPVTQLSNVILSTGTTNFNLISGSGISIAGSTPTANSVNLTLSADTSLMLSRATDQAATDIVLLPTSNSGTSYQACPTPTLSGYIGGSRFILIPDSTSLASPSINLCGLGPIPLNKNVGSSLIAISTGDIVQGIPYLIIASSSPISSFEVSPAPIYNTSNPQPNAVLNISSGTIQSISVSTATYSPFTFATLGSSAPNGSFEYCADCTVTTPATCVGVISAACVCTNSGSGAFAKRLNGNWYCN